MFYVPYSYKIKFFYELKIPINSLATVHQSKNNFQLSQIPLQFFLFRTIFLNQLIFSSPVPISKCFILWIFTSFKLIYMSYHMNLFYTNQLLNIPSNLNQSLPRTAILATDVTINSFQFNFIHFYIKALINFLFFHYSLTIFFKFSFFFKKYLTTQDLILVFFWKNKLKKFQKRFGILLHLDDIISLIFLAFKTKDPLILVNWLKIIFKKLNFWKYKSFFFFLNLMLKVLVKSSYSLFSLIGLKTQIKGKVSVAGNSRKRKFLLRSFKTSFVTYKYPLYHELILIPTFTGVLAFRVWFFYDR